MRRQFILALAFATLSAPAMAQMSVSVVGATDAQLCFEAAGDNFATSTANCDDALRRGGLSKHDEVATRVNRGIVLNRAERFKEALADFDYALAMSPDTAEAYLNRGNCYFMQRRFDDAIADYEKSIKLGITKADVAWYNVGLAHEAKKDTAKAKEAYRTALEINPDFGPALKKLSDEPSPDRD